MGALGVCPCCGVPISARSFFRISRHIPYECTKCGSKSVIPAHSGMKAMILFVAALSVPLFALEFLGVPRVVLFVACVAGVVAIPLVFARICRFDPIAEDHGEAKS